MISSRNNQNHSERVFLLITNFILAYLVVFLAHMINISFPLLPCNHDMHKSDKRELKSTANDNTEALYLSLVYIGVSR